MTPPVARAIVVAAAIAAVVIAALEPRNGATTARARAGELHFRYVYSPDAEGLVAPLVDRFNLEKHEIGGRVIHVDAEALTSGAAETALARRLEKPVLWTPASSLWGRLLNYDVSTPWVPASNPSLVVSPQVIAMWKPLARALGWPKRRIGWGDLLALATSHRGWAAYDHPEFGSFKLGHTNPDFSTSGLSAIASEYYAVTGKRTNLTLADVRRPAVRAAVRSIERSIVHYGETAKAFTDQMDRYGEAYAHAVYVQETTVQEFNKHRKQATPLVAIEPKEGTFVADYPLIVLDTPWTRASGRTAAEVFRRWLVPRITRPMATANGFRLRRPKGLALLQFPNPEVLAAIRRSWHADRKPANIVLVVDTSSSMGGEGRLDAAKLGLLSFLRALSPDDRVALVTSGARVETEVRLGLPQRSRSAVARAVRKLFPNGELPVYGAVSRALAELRALGEATRINALVVLSDGASTSAGARTLLDEIRARPVTEGTSVRIFTVAYGSNADAQLLQRIATASGGAFFAGSPNDIAGVYQSISSYF